jgi:hypothetical protein
MIRTRTQGANPRSYVNSLVRYLKILDNYNANDVVVKRRSQDRLQLCLGLVRKNQVSDVLTWFNVRLSQNDLNWIIIFGRCSHNRSKTVSTHFIFQSALNSFCGKKVFSGYRFVKGLAEPKISGQDILSVSTSLLTLIFNGSSKFFQRVWTKNCDAVEQVWPSFERGH